MDSTTGNTPLMSKGKMRLLAGISAAVLITVVLSVSQDMTSVFTGSVTKNRPLKLMDLSVVWSGPTVVQSSEDIVQTIDVSNAGPEMVKKFQLIQPTPADLRFVSVQASDPITRVTCGMKEQRSLFVCTVHPAGNGLVQDGHVTIMITFATHGANQPASCGRITRSGDLVVTSEEKNMTDTNADNNRATGFETAVDCSDITTEVSVNAQALPAPIVPSQTMQYMVTAINNGPGKTKGAKIHQKYAAGLTFAGSNVQNCTDDPEKREVVCNPGDDTDGMQGILLPGQSTQIELSFTVDPTVPGCTFVTGNSSVTVPVTGTDALIDPVPENNQTDLTTEVACQ